MGKLFFYSDQVAESLGNRRLDKTMFAGLNPSKVKIGYIPSTEDKGRMYFNTKVQYYRNYGVQNIMFFDLYSDFNPSQVKELLSCDIIHLSAGNPIQFRHALKNREMDKVLLNYFENGGTIAGVSGGAVQFGKSAALFQLFSGQNNNEYVDTLSLVDFEFLPHFNRWNKDFIQEVLKYSEVTDTTIYAGRDGDGMTVDDGSIQMFGDVVKIRNGIIS